MALTETVDAMLRRHENRSLDDLMKHYGRQTVMNVSQIRDKLATEHGIYASKEMVRKWLAAADAMSFRDRGGQR